MQRETRPAALAVATLALLLSVSPCFAQGRNGGGNRGGGPGGRGGFGMTDPSMLVNIPAVQEEIKLTDKQKAKLKALDEKVQTARRQFMPNFGRGGPGGNNGGPGGNNGGPGGNNGGGGRFGNNGGQPGMQGGAPAFDFQAMREQMNLLREQQTIELGKILSAKQFARVKEIAVQADGVNAFTRPEFMEEAGVDEEQKANIDGIIQGMRGKQREMMTAQRQAMPQGANGRPDRQAMQDFMNSDEGKAFMKKNQTDQEKLRSTTMKLVMKALYPQQLAVYKKMTGKPFDLTKLQPNGGNAPPWMRGGPGGPGGPGAPGGQANNGGPGGNRRNRQAQNQNGDQAEDDAPASPGNPAAKGAQGAGAAPSVAKAAPASKTAKPKSSLRAKRELEDDE